MIKFINNSKAKTVTLTVGIILFLIWLVVLLSIQVGKAHDMEIAQVEIALQQAERDAESYRWALLDLEQENYILEDTINQMEAHIDSMRYTEDSE